MFSTMRAISAPRSGQFPSHTPENAVISFGTSSAGAMIFASFGRGTFMFRWIFSPATEIPQKVIRKIHTHNERRREISISYHLVDYSFWFKKRVMKTKTERGANRVLKASNLFIIPGMMIFLPFIKPAKPVSATSAACINHG